MKNISSRRRITKGYKTLRFIRRVLCAIFLIPALFSLDIFGADIVKGHDAVLAASCGKTAYATETFATADAYITLGAVKTPVKRTGMERANKNFEAAFSLSYIRLATAALFAVIILSAKYVFSRRKGKGRIRAVIEDSETVTEYRETELHDMPHLFTIDKLITCADLWNEDVVFTVPLIGERLRIKNYSELQFFKNGTKMPEEFSIIYGDSVTLRIQKFDVTIVYLDE